MLGWSEAQSAERDRLNLKVYSSNTCTNYLVILKKALSRKRRKKVSQLRHSGKLVSKEERNYLMTMPYLFITQ